MALRMGVFGGTFDPVHIGHLMMAAEVMSSMKLDRMLWMPAAHPPHKQSDVLTALQHRIAMIQLAVADEPRFEISRLDIERPGPHYTVDSLRLLHEKMPDTSIVLLLGGDSLHDLPRWHEPVALVQECDAIAVFKRPSSSIDLTALGSVVPGLSGKVRMVDGPLLEISSTEIRNRVSRGLPFRYLVPEPVYQYIMQHRLYIAN